MVGANLGIISLFQLLHILNPFLVIIFGETIKTCTLFTVLPERVVTASKSYTIQHFYRIIFIEKYILWY